MSSDEAHAISLCTCSVEEDCEAMIYKKIGVLYRAILLALIAMLLFGLACGPNASGAR